MRQANTDPPAGSRPVLLNIKPSRVARPVDLTDRAVEKVKALLAVEHDGDAMGLRVAVRPGGCAGLSYDLFFDADIDADDIEADFDGLRVVVDARSAERVRGAVIDYRDSLMEGGFSIDNPNAARSCGCGNSFA